MIWFDPDQPRIINHPGFFFRVEGVGLDDPRQTCQGAHHLRHSAHSGQAFDGQKDGDGFIFFHSRLPLFTLVCQVSTLGSLAPIGGEGWGEGA